MTTQNNYASMDREELIEYAAQRMIELADENGWFSTDKDSNFYSMCIFYGITEEARKRAGVKKHEPKWSSMSENERFEYAVDYIKKHSDNGKFIASNHDSFYSAMRRYGIFYKALEQSGVNLPKERKLINMDQSQRVEWAVGYLKKKCKNGIFKATYHKDFYNLCRHYRILDEALEKSNVKQPSKSKYKNKSKKELLDMAKEYILEISNDGVLITDERTRKFKKLGVFDEALIACNVITACEHKKNMKIRKELIRIEEKAEKEVQRQKLKAEKEVQRQKLKAEKEVQRQKLKAEKEVQRQKLKVEKEANREIRRQNTLENKIVQKKDFKFLGSTYQDFFEEAKKYFNENHTKNNTFTVYKHLPFVKEALKHGVFYTALLENRIYIGRLHNKVLKYAYKKILIKVQPYNKQKLSECVTVNELIGTYFILYGKKELLEIPNYKVLTHLWKDFPLTDLPLKTFDYFELKDISKNKQNFPISFYTKIVFPKAIRENIFTLCGLEKDPALRVEFLNIAKNSVKKASTIFEYYLKYRNCSKSDIVYGELYFLAHYGNILIEDFTLQLLNSVELKNYKYDANRQWKYKFKSAFIKPLIENDILKQNFFFHLEFDKILIDFLENKEKVPLSERTVMWYALEYHSFGRPKRMISLLSSQHTKDNFLKAYGPLVDVKAKDFTPIQLNILKKCVNDKQMLAYAAVVNKMIDDELCSPNIFHDAKKIRIKEFDFESNVWKFKVKSIMDFSIIENLSFMNALKHYVWEVTDGLKKDLQGGFNKHIELLNIFQKLGAKKLLDIDINLQKRFQLYLLKRHQNELNSSAKTLLKIFRKLFQTLSRLQYKDVNTSLIIYGDKFKLPAKPSKITPYNEEDMKKILEIIKTYEDRLTACAIGLLALFARRISETVCSNISNINSGFKINTLRKVGLTNDYCLVIEHSKQHKVDITPLSVMVGNRSDPFGKELIELGVELFYEALEITNQYRHLAPKELQQYLFIEKKKSGGYGLMRGGVVRTKLKKLYNAYGINTSMTVQEFRHTMASNLILSGGTIGDAADALNDEEGTVSKYYHKYAEKTETLQFFAKIGRSEMVSPLEDSEFFKELQKKRYKVIRADEVYPTMHSIVGGKCEASLDEMLQCPNYMMINDENGCGGCKNLRVVAEINRAYWEGHREIKLKEMDAAQPGSWWFEKAKTGFELAESILEDMEQKELEDEFGI